eukprot:Platyproteum_vivax@DN3318_c0_g1_i1.p1
MATVPSMERAPTFKRAGTIKKAGTMKGSKMPRIIYGTAWKKDKTSELVMKAIELGFRGIDTAAQPKHYREDLVGVGIAAAIDAKLVNREDIYIQTKFSPVDAKSNDVVPYDKNAPYETQVEQSISSSLTNLKTEYIDCLILHSPLDTVKATMTVWSSMEDAVRRGTVRQLGLSNCYDLEMLQDIYEKSHIKPSVLQNRFYKETNYDRLIRSYCTAFNIVYESFWTLTANPHILNSRPLTDCARKLDLSYSQCMYRFMMGLGCLPLTGTTNELHMEEALEILQVEMDYDDVEKIEKLLKD